jgi:imidazolonepropionase-like amidohydrolase
VPSGSVELEEADARARVDRDAGTLLIRDCGSPIDTTPLQARDDLPEIIRAGRHLARPKRYIPNMSLELDDPALLPDVVAEQAAAGDGWVKLVGDWIDRGVGDLAPLWSDDVLVAAIDSAHRAGARVTAHVFGAAAIPGLVRAGIDCIEHGTGLTDDLIAEMAERGTALVPTLINVENFPGIADQASRYPAYADHMRRLHAGAYETVRRAVEAGVPVYAGTDAGGGIDHGRLADEVIALHRAGLSAADALGAASWAARSWLGRPGLESGARADLVVYRSDPRADLSVLHDPALVMLRGRPVHAGR